MANFNLNKVIVGGRLTADPELKATPTGVYVTTFSVAINRKVGKDGKQVADFINVTAWRQTAEFVCRYFRRASSICVVGTLESRTWTNQNGESRYALEVVAQEVHFVDSKAENGGNAAPASQYVPDQYKTQSPPQFAEVENDENLPF